MQRNVRTEKYDWLAGWLTSLDEIWLLRETGVATIDVGEEYFIEASRWIFSIFLTQINHFFHCDYFVSSSGEYPFPCLLYLLAKRIDQDKNAAIKVFTKRFFCTIEVIIDFDRFYFASKNNYVHICPIWSFSRSRRIRSVFLDAYWTVGASLSTQSSDLSTNESYSSPAIRYGSCSISIPAVRTVDQWFSDYSLTGFESIRRFLSLHSAACLLFI